MAETTTHGGRFDWIDWMKVLGIYLVVLGHFNTVGNQFVYVFHVPLFFVISGFLCKRECDGRLFWQKLWYNLAVPMLMLATLNYAYYCALKLYYGTFELVQVYWFVRNVLFGMMSGFGPLWFVYTLILLKIIYQYCTHNSVFYVLTVPFLGLSVLYNHYDLSGTPFFLKAPNVIVNICTAFPFFALGIFLHKYKMRLHEWDNKLMLLATFVCGLSLTVVCYHFNGFVALFRCDYGDHLLLFLIGGVAGTMMVFALSKLLGGAPKVVEIISRGTIIILGLHINAVLLIQEACPVWLALLYAVMIIMVLVPVIILIERYFPLMAGKYRVNKSNVGKIKG